MKFVLTKKCCLNIHIAIYIHIYWNTHTQTHTRARANTHTHTHTHTYIYTYLLNTPTGGKSCLVAPGVALPPGATKTVWSPWLASDEGRVSHVFSHVVWWNIYIYIYLYILVYWNIYDEHWIVCETFFV